MKQLLLMLMVAATCLSCRPQRHPQETPMNSDTYTTSGGKQVSFRFIKHASLEINYDGYLIQVDPVRELPPATDYSAFAKANLVLVTHEHFDHYDPEAIATLTGDDTQVVLNKRCAEMLGHGIALANGDTLRLRDDIVIEAVPAYNISPDHLQFHPKGRDNGYVLTLGGLRVYIAGDTEDIPEMARLRDIHIAFLPCNQPFTMTPAQLARAAKMFSPQVLYPYHYSETPVGEAVKLLDGSGIEVKIRPMK